MPSLGPTFRAKQALKRPGCIDMLNNRSTVPPTNFPTSHDGTLLEALTVQRCSAEPVHAGETIPPAFWSPSVSALGSKRLVMPISGVPDNPKCRETR